MAATARPRELVGRQQPRSLLIESLADRETSIVSVSGSFGMGRTHLARQVAQDLTTRRHAVHWVAGKHADATPFGPLRPAALAARRPPPTTFEQACALLSADDDRPGFVVVDDAHALANDVVEVLGHLVAQGRSRLLLTQRTGLPLPVALWEYPGSSDQVRIALQPLERADIADLCAEILGAPVNAALVDTVAHRSTGRPRLVRDLVLDALVRDEVVLQHDEWCLLGQLDPTVALGGIVRAELATFGRSGRDLLEAVALARSVDADALAELWNEALAEELEEQGWLHAETRPGGGASVRLAEPLVAELITDTLGTLRRRRHVARLAHLAGRGHSGLPPEQAVLLRNEAGEHLPLDDLRNATTRLVADERIDAALALATETWERSGAAADGDQLGRVLTQLNRSDEAERVFAAASENAQSDTALANLTLPRAENLWFAARSEEARAVCRAALTSLADTTAKALVTAELANLCARDGDVRAAVDVLAELEALDDVSDTPQVVAGLARTLTEVWGGRPDQAVAPGARASAAAEEPTTEPLPPRLYELILLGRADAQCFAGRFPDACEWLDELHWCAIELRTSFGVAATALIRARLESERGCITDARVWLSRAVHAFDHAGLGRFTTLTDEVLALIEARHGDVHLAQHLLDAPAHVHVVQPIVHAALDGRARAWVDHRLGDLDRATDRQHTTLELLLDHHARTEAVGVLIDAAVMGRASEFATDAESLLDVVDGPLLRARLGMVVAAGIGDVRSLERHGATLAGIGSHLDAANAYALAATVAGTRGDDQVARLDVARAIAAIVGADGGRSIVLERLQPSIELLTEREHLVARLAAEGQSSRDIAARLTISVRTVDNLLGRVYRKLHVNGRAELADVLVSS